MRNLRSNIDVVMPRRKSVEVLRKGTPVPRQPGVEYRPGNVLDSLHEFDQHGAVLGPAGREADAAVAHHGRGHAVQRAGRKAGVPHHMAVVVRVDVHETGRHDAPARVDDLVRALSQVADACDLAVDHFHVRFARHCSGAIDHRSTPDQQ